MIEWADEMGISMLVYFMQNQVSKYMLCSTHGDTGRRERDNILSFKFSFSEMELSLMY